MAQDLSLNRSTMIVLLNRTNEELCLDTNSRQPLKGIWTTDMCPPTSILAGESGLWQSKSSKLGRGTMGFVAYRIAGDPNQHVVVTSWQNPFFGYNTYQGSVAQEEFEVQVHGGSGTHAIGVFVLQNTNGRSS